MATTTVSSTSATPEPRPPSPIRRCWSGRGDYPGWRGRYWAFLDDGEHGVLRLHPINVARHSAQRAA
ncbi:hypothetical protein ACIA5H_30225 [Nocardia sp. NPDC051900]|uniref:hypothetical protein n=1 Tax=Nocardia sp. NPDC051900 TaxID=3364326 RepID=UPI00378A3EA1